MSRPDCNSQRGNEILDCTNLPSLLSTYWFSLYEGHLLLIPTQSAFPENGPLTFFGKWPFPQLWAVSRDWSIRYHSPFWLKGGHMVHARLITMFSLDIWKGWAQPCLVWLSGLSAGLQTRVASSIPSQGTCLGCRSGPQEGGHQTQPHIEVSLPLFLPPFPSL